ncbi:hypothetical protein [Acidilobus sp.]|uniref:hypothetical protein n=1 Tax=Acidilobus sp. TaxID=1872109 RepID=UPI003CFBD7DD
MKVLVAGLVPRNSGKTTLAASLTAQLIREGFTVAPSKPVGATDLWGSPDAVAYTRRLHVLATEDGYVLYKASGERLPVEIVNPVGALLVPTPRSKYPSRTAYEASLSQPYSRAALLRITSCVGGSSSVHLVNSAALSRVTRPVEQEVQDIVSYLTPPPVQVNEQVVEGIFMGSANEAADSCIALEERSSDVVVIESNSDVAAPTPASAAPDLVVLVSPGEAYIVDGRRYRSAMEILVMDGKPWVSKASELFELTGYTGRVELPLLEDPREGYGPEVTDPIVEAVKGAAASGSKA